MSGLAAPAWWRRRPWWLRLALGIGCAGLGVVLATRPFTSLTVLVLLVAVGMWATGIATLASADDTWPRVAGIGWLIIGLAVVAIPDLSIRAVALVAGCALIVDGAIDVVAGGRASADRRAAAVIGGTASAIFGVLALVWPDVTILVVAVVFGARLVLFGLRTAWDAVHERRMDRARPSPATEPGRLRRIGHVAGAVAALLVAAALASVSARIRSGAPVVDEFYTAPGSVPATPGALVRIEPFERTIPDGARAWRILYTTTRDEGVPAVASALVVAPAVPQDAPMPVVAVAHGTTGIDRRCAPSLLDDPFAAGAFFSLDATIAEGWAVVATDYVGLGTEGPHPYLVGQPSGRAVLDSVRAARQIDQIALGEQTVVWGHSQGGGAALWTGALASAYAPDVGVVAVAALAPAADLVGLVDGLRNIAGGSIFASYTVDAYAQVYPDVRLGDYVRPGARATFARIARTCLSEPAMLVSALQAVATDMSVFDGDPARGPFLERLGENVPTWPVAAPLLIAQGSDDPLVGRATQDAYVAARCEAGQAVDYRVYDGEDHLSLVAADSPLIPDLFAWTRARLAGEPPTPTCP